MKRIGCMVLALLFAVSLSACGISIRSDEAAVLTFEGPYTNGHSAPPQTLTPEETARVEEILEEAEYIPSGAGCPFNEGVSISFDERVFAISCDGCNTVLDIEAQRYYEVTREGRQYIIDLFKTYTGYFPVSVASW